MCYNPIKIRNKRYVPNKKNEGNPPPMLDGRKGAIEIPCGCCAECRKKRSREWIVRLTEELREKPKVLYVRLSLSDEKIVGLEKRYGMYEANEIAAKEVRLWTERYRKKYKVAPRHWLCTELGQKNSERIHMHGFIWITEEQLKETWTAGNYWVGEYLGEQSIKYMVKYFTKIDKKHPGFTGKVLASKGIGREFFDKQEAFRIAEETDRFYTMKSGHKIAIPTYFKNKLLTEEQRDEYWTEMLDKGITYFDGEEYKNSWEEGERLKKARQYKLQRNIEDGLLIENRKKRAEKLYHAISDDYRKKLYEKWGV